MTTELEANETGLMIGGLVLTAVGDWQQNAPRTRQSAARVLGMSEMGGCREYIRASIAGDVKAPPDPLKWAAFIGTAVGDMIEKILGDYGFITQEDVTLTLPRTGIQVSGHLDARTSTYVLDLKSVDGLADVEREGPSFKNKAQISGYLVGLVQMGKLDEASTGHLVYYDRSGKTSETYVWSVTYDQALLILDAVDDRLTEVAESLATGRHASRDEPESWCYAISCPFYMACWDGYTPTGKVEHPRQLDAVRRRVEARDDAKNAAERLDQAKEDLRGVEGVTPDGTIVRWTLSETPTGRIADVLNVRTPK